MLYFFNGLACLLDYHVPAIKDPAMCTMVHDPLEMAGFFVPAAQQKLLGKLETGPTGVFYQ